jgi:DNA polymerase II large subunit
MFIFPLADLQSCDKKNENFQKMDISGQCRAIKEKIQLIVQTCVDGNQTRSQTEYEVFLSNNQVPHSLCSSRENSK